MAFFWSSHDFFDNVPGLLLNLKDGPGKNLYMPSVLTATAVIAVFWIQRKRG
jgi:hypothetical protein